MPSLLSHTVAAANTTVTSDAIDTTGATKLIIGFSCLNAYSATPTDSKSNTWAEIATYSIGGYKVSVWESVPTSTGTGHTFTAPPNLTGTMFVLAFDGSAGAVDQQAGTSGFGTTIQPGSITPTLDGELIISILCINGSGSPMSIDSGFTKVDEMEFSGGLFYGGAIAYKVQTAKTAENPTWTRTNLAGNVAAQISFKPLRKSNFAVFV